MQATYLMLDRDPIVSVVMSVRDEADFVVDAIESILNQSVRNLEFIIVDDGSQDESVAMIRQFGDTRIRLLVQQENLGLATSLNLGIRSAKGKYIARQDADDLSDPGRLERQVEYLERHREVGLVGCNVLVIDESGRSLVAREFPRASDTLKHRLITGENGNPFVHGATVFRKSTAIDAGLYRPEFKQAQDLDLWLRIAERSQLGSIREIAYRWRIRRSSTGASNWESQRDYGELARWCARCRRSGQSEPDLSLFEIQQVPARKFLGKFRPRNLDSDYYLKIGAMMLSSGFKSDARMYLRKAVRRNPLNAYGWLLLGLTITSPKTTNAIWSNSRKLYRRMIWKHPV